MRRFLRRVFDVLVLLLAVRILAAGLVFVALRLPEVVGDDWAVHAWFLVLIALLVLLISFRVGPGILARRRRRQIKLRELASCCARCGYYLRATPTVAQNAG
jgi:hypothetical protein